MESTTKIMLGNIKGILVLVVAVLILDALSNVLGPDLFGIKFSVINWILIILAVLLFVSDLKDIDLIEKFFSKIM